MQAVNKIPRANATLLSESIVPRKMPERWRTDNEIQPGEFRR